MCHIPNYIMDNVYEVKGHEIINCMQAPVFLRAILLAINVL